MSESIIGCQELKVMMMKKRKEGGGKHGNGSECAQCLLN